MKEKLTMPEPNSRNWRQAYAYNKTDLPQVSSYQAPNGSPVPFIFDKINLSGGQSVDTAEFPFYGFWSNTSLNEKPQSIKINGFLRCEDYIAHRISLLAALRTLSSDDDPGFLDLPLWGRFPVVVTEWSIDENGSSNGQCSLSITVIRAGISESDRISAASDKQTIGDINTACNALKETAIQGFTEVLSKQSDRNMLLSAFDKFKMHLYTISGRIQGAQNFLNNITNEIQGIATLLAQGISAPKTLATALFSAFSSVIASIATIKNAAAQYLPSFSTGDTDASTGGTPTTGKYFSAPLIQNNERNALIEFLALESFTLPDEPVSEAERVTKIQSENLYKTCALFAVAQLLPELENTTYQQQESLWTLFERLEQSIQKDNPELAATIDGVRMALSKTLIDKKATNELLIQIQSPMPILALAHYLSCDQQTIRRLNRVANSFVLQGDITYV